MSGKGHLDKFCDCHVKQILTILVCIKYEGIYYREMFVVRLKTTKYLSNMIVICPNDIDAKLSFEKK